MEKRAVSGQFFAINAAISIAALGLLGWLLLVRQPVPPSVDLRFVPTLNACLNALAASLLVAGWFAIRRGRRTVHMRLMVSAFASSTAFLVGYIAYHYAHGDTRYEGVGAMRLVYFTVLITHVLLSMTVVPLALTTFYLAWKERFVAHRKIARITLPIWLYVSITGVVIYFMLR